MDDSERLSVRLFQAPDTDELDRLPDSAVFVLRAIVQLERGTVDDICQATGLPASSVQDALRYGLVRGYFRLVEDRYRIRWTWFRAITRFLQRRHLLFAGDST
jgi:DNA-binding IclR family transcriptional regulator